MTKQFQSNSVRNIHGITSADQVIRGDFERVGERLQVRERWRSPTSFEVRDRGGQETALLGQIGLTHFPKFTRSTKSFGKNIGQLAPLTCYRRIRIVFDDGSVIPRQYTLSSD
jgi:hypothetical protein